MRTPSYLLARIRFEKTESRHPSGHPVFKNRAPGETVTTLTCGAFDSHWLASPSTTVATSPAASDVTLVLHGELYPHRGPTSADDCLEAYLEKGMGFVEHLSGSFAMGVIDLRQARIFLATDPINSRKLFFGRHDGSVWLSTAHTLHRHPCSGRPDPAGLAHCLVNGVPLNGHTPFKGIRVLERASVHELVTNSAHTRTYWSYEPDGGSLAPKDSLKTDLRDALLEAVKRQLPDSGEMFLSLSGGYDSVAVLGALGHHGVDGVRCFTYRKPSETERSDASVAREMAKIAGYEYTEIEAYGDSAAHVVDENVRWGCGLTRLVVETDSWRTLRSIMPEDDATTLWVADECLGMSPPRVLRNVSDTFNSLAIGDWSSLGSLSRCFSRSAAALLAEALRTDLESIREGCRAIQDPYVLRDYLYLHERLPRLLSWREAFAEPCGRVRNPLMDRDILELRQSFPRQMGLGKSLYKDTVTELFPDLFSLERAAAGMWFAGQWCRDALRTHSVDLANLVRGAKSPLDPFLTPDTLLGLIEEASRSEGTPPSEIGRVRGLRGRFRKRVGRIGKRTLPASVPGRVRVDPAVFILRAVTLRELYRRRADW